MTKIKSVKSVADLPRPYHTLVMSRIDKETDRGVAIVGGAYADVVLRDAIAAQGQNPPKGFGALIKSAYTLSLYSATAYSDLGLIKNIRNAFTHSVEAMDFAHADVAKSCDDLWFPKKTHYGQQDMPVTAREKFIRAIELPTDGFLENIDRRQKGFALCTFLGMGPRKATP